MRTWVTDMRHLPTVSADVPAPARRRAELVRAVVEAATSRSASAPWRSAVRCVGRRAGSQCGSQLEVARRGDTVEWSCDGCGDSGTVTSFADTDSDLSRYVPTTKMVMWGIDEEERKLLMAATTELFGLRAVVSRARPHHDIEGLLLVEATVAELNEVYTLVEELTDGTRGRRRIELLDGLRASLCTSIDGF